MFIFDISNPLTLILMLAATVLLIFLAQEVKKSFISAIILFVYLVLLIVHVAQIATISEEYMYSNRFCVYFNYILILSLGR